MRVIKINSSVQDNAINSRRGNTVFIMKNFKRHLSFCSYTLWRKWTAWNRPFARQFPEYQNSFIFAQTTGETFEKANISSVSCRKFRCGENLVKEGIFFLSRFEAISGIQSFHNVDRNIPQKRQLLGLDVSGMNSGYFLWNQRAIPKNENVIYLELSQNEVELLYRLLHSSLNLAFTRRKLHLINNIFIFGMACCVLISAAFFSWNVCFLNPLLQG